MISDFTYRCLIFGGVLHKNKYNVKQYECVTDGFVSDKHTMLIDFD
jgi:hypothetical protein